MKPSIERATSLVTGILLLALSLGLGACRPVQPVAVEVVALGAQGGELIVALNSDIVAVDPAFASDVMTNQVVNQISEPLLKYNPDGTLAPHLAERWENPDPLTYIYHIRQGVTFHDGTPLTVDDVLFSMERIRNPETASYLAWMYQNVDTIEQTGAWTIQVTLKQPDALWQYVPATSAGLVISNAYYAAHQANFGKPEGGLLGTGPFQFVSWATGSEVVLKRYDQYWDKANGGPYLDRIVFKVVPDSTTRIVGLKTGELHLALGPAVPSDQLPVIRQMDQVDLTFADSTVIIFIAFNTQRPPFDNRNVRQALSYALDKAQFTQTVFGEAGVVARSPVPPALWTFEHEKSQAAYEQLPTYEHNLEQAQQLLAESGVADQLNGKVIVTYDDPAVVAQALALQGAAAELGFDLQVQKLPIAEYMTIFFGGARDYDILVSGWAPDFPDPAAVLVQGFHSSKVGEGGTNLGNYRNPTVDRLLDEQNALTDKVKRADLLLQVQQIVVEDAVWILLSYPKPPMALNKKFTGYTILPLYGWDPYARNIKKQ